MLLSRSNLRRENHTRRRNHNNPCSYNCTPESLIKSQYVWLEFESFITYRLVHNNPFLLIQLHTLPTESICVWLLHLPSCSCPLLAIVSESKTTVSFTEQSFYTGNINNKEQYYPVLIVPMVEIIEQ